MSDPDITSTEQEKVAVKVKYSSKAKRKRSNINDTQSEEQSDLGESNMSDEKQITASPEVASKTPGTPSGPKVVDVHLPGPSPKRQQRDSEESQAPSKPISKSTHARGSSTSTNSSHVKPPSSARSSSAKLSQHRRPESPADDADETSSIAESSTGVRVRRTEPERMQYLKDQPECSELEAHRAFCTRCNSWVNLGKPRTYMVRRWEVHRVKCDQKPPAEKDDEPVTNAPSQVTEPQEQPADKVEPNPVDEKEPLPSPTTSVAVTGENDDATSPTSSRSIRRSEAERIAFLQADSRAQEVKPHEVFCRSCQKWIKLAINAPYVLANWQAHQQRCSGSFPSSRIATTERKIALLNDPQVKSCSPQSIHCRVCKSTVALDGAVDYDLTKWNEHKEKCVAMTPAPMTPQGSISRIPRVFPPPFSSSITSQTSASRLSRAPASSDSYSTEATAIADSPPHKIGVKRGREEAAEETEEAPKDDRPTNRPRTEGYEPSEKEAPSPWGWFTQPLKAFVRGFREGLGTPSTST
ncbi:hypothetical protein PAXINDRAFT_165777 [Paxillus involutus ATCC 200175]|nr:hypothetical protein PAXINDRAFT_165777 [Paxillus involutus ATCC 200175]